jgi:hypothetical protein
MIRRDEVLDRAGNFWWACTLAGTRTRLGWLLMIARFFNFRRKRSDHFQGAWGGQAAGDFEPERNYVELLRFAALLLSDTDRRDFTRDQILECITSELKVQLAVGDKERLLAGLLHHASFERIADNRFLLV